MVRPNEFHSARLWRELMLGFLAFSVLVAAVSSLWRNNLILTLIMLIEVSVTLYRWHEWEDLSFLVVVGGMGALAEAVFVRSGAWHYANPSFLGVPVWFPIAFGTAGLILGRLSWTVAALWRGRSSPPRPAPASDSFAFPEPQRSSRQPRLAEVDERGRSRCLPVGPEGDDG